MNHADFVHLHNHSDYSLLDGASSIPKMVERAAEMRMPALALTDHGSLFGAVEFYQEARRAGVKPILGMEAYVTRGDHRERTRDTAHHLVLLARDEQGFKNLMRLSSYAFLEGFYYKPRVDHALLAQHAAGLLALSACPKGEVASDLLEDNEEGAFRTAMMYRDMFGPENYFLEIQNHGIEIEEKIRERIATLSRRTGIPRVATNDCHYLRHEDADAHDVLLCIQTGKTVGDTKRMMMNTDQLFFRSPAEMKAAFDADPDAIRNTLAVAERCNLQLSFGRPLLPEFPLPPGSGSPEEYLSAMARAAMADRCPGGGASMRERLEYELDVICRMGFASYFLIVRDFIAYAREQGIAVGPGRGSVAGSLVAYVLRITDIDPIQHGLIFERFLNPERVSMPDIDIDFDDLRRGEVIEYVKRRYGEGNVTQIITFGTMGAKGVVRDVGRALGMAFTDVDRIAKLVPDGLNMTLEKALELSPDLKNLPHRGPAYARLLKSARALEGLARHASTHAAGVLITPGPLLDFVPLYRQKDESVTTQWDMKAIEKAGLLKMDFLGLRTLSVLQQAVARVADSTGAAIDLRALPDDDAAAYEVFQRADTVGIFQFESTGMRDYLRQLKPTVFEDLVSMNALYRPGPMEHIPFFIDCKHGKQVARYEHPDLQPILESTYGVFVFQEQVMQAANTLAGFSMAQADELRRAMGKKKPEEMEAKRAQFIDGCKKNKIAATKAEKIFATMEKFAGYGFNRCAAAGTVVEDADTGRRWTIGEIFRKRPTIRVHGLGDDWKLHRRRVKDVVWNGVREVFEVRTALGKRLLVTANHPLRRLDGWVCVSDLRPGDRIAAPRCLESGARRRWPWHELVALAGLISEGNTCHPTTLHFYCNERPLVDDFARAVGMFEDTVARIWSRGDRRLEVHANLGRHYRVRDGDEVVYEVEGNLAVVCDAEGRRSGAFRWAERLGLLGKKATQKRVPPEVFELAKADVRLFLGRLWSGDGFIANASNNPPFYATSSEGLAVDVQALLLRLGMVSRIQSKQFKYRGGHKPGYTVSLIGENVRSAFLEQLGPHILGRDAALRLLGEQVATCAADRSSKDTVPMAVFGRIDAERTRFNWTTAELHRRAGVIAQKSRRVRVSAGLRRSTLARVASALDCLDLERLATSDVYWDRVVSIEPRGVQDTYDLTVEHDHNFVADGLIVHNSHSAAYALLAYQTAYLKAHHPAEFMAATLTSEMADSARIVTLIEECRRMGLVVLAPDVNRSDWRFTLEDGRIRFGLGAVKNVGQSSVDSIVAARAGEGAFKDLFDLALRVDERAINRRVLESLVAAGACDALGPERGAMHAGAGRVLEQAEALKREKRSGQSSLFGEAEEGGVAVVAPPLPPSAPWTGSERSAKEKEVLGFYFSEHPLEPLRGMMSRLVTHSIAEALESEDGAEVRVGGIVLEVRRLTTRAGKPMGAVTLEDLTGRIEATVFPDTWETARALLETDRVVVVSGRIEVREDRGMKLLLAEARSLDQARSEYRPCLHLEVRSEDLSVTWLEQVDETLSGFPGEADVYLHIVMPDRSRKASRSKRYQVAEDERVVGALRERFPFVRVAWGKGIA